MPLPKSLRTRRLKGGEPREEPVAHVTDVAAYVLRQRGPMTAMKVQKLCFYALGYHWAWEERPLFPEPFEAWANGPVCRDLYRQHRGQVMLRAGDINGDPTNLDPGERESIDLVLQGYGGLSAQQLSALTHREAPWMRARARAGVAPMQRSTEPIRDADIYEFFDAAVATDGEED
jgi:uncharacterized phage-associated protein